MPELLTMTSTGEKILDSSDRDNLKQLGKKCKEANFPLSAVIDYLRDNNPAFGAIISTICLNDDGRIDSTEAQLVRWARTFVFRIGGAEIMEAENLLMEGYHSVMVAEPRTMW